MAEFHFGTQSKMRKQSAAVILSQPGRRAQIPPRGHDPGLGLWESIGYLGRPRGCLLARSPHPSPGFSSLVRAASRGTTGPCDGRAEP